MCRAPPWPRRAGHAGAGTPVPAAFKANSVTWVSAQRGWVLGAAPCGKNTCSDVIGTTDGGKTWQLTGTVKAPLANIGKGTHGVTEVRFATPTWAGSSGSGACCSGPATAASPGLRMPVPGGAKQVLGLAASATQTYAITSDCTLGKALCAKPLGFWRIATGRQHLDPHPAEPAREQRRRRRPCSARRVYVVDAQLEFGRPDKLYASTDGVHFAARPAPCNHAQDIALIQAVPMPAGHVALLCDGNPGFSKAVKTVYVSANTGKTDTFAGQMGLFGIQAAAGRVTVGEPGRGVRGPTARSSTSTTPTRRPGPWWRASATAAPGGTTSAT